VSRIAALLRLALYLALAGIVGFGTGAFAREHNDHSNATLTVALGDLPTEARQTLLLIHQGGPFPFPHKDGSTFGNFEKYLPSRSRGYYREYTVPTPGRRDRGARRIIAGEGRNGDVATSGEYYYTDDHYNSFRRILEP
jgi:ribonuclease T1